MKRVFCGIFFVVAAAIGGCGGGGGGGGAVPGVPHGPDNPTPMPPPATKKIQHVVIVIQENRSFDNLFAKFPGADGTTYGILHTGQRFNLTRAPLTGKELNHMRSGYLTEYDNGKMDGFDLIGFGSSGTGGPAKRYPLRYVNPADIKPYWTMAKDYELADHMFQTQGSGSFTAHQELIAGGTVITPTKSLIDFPSQGPWGCDAPTPGPNNNPPGTVTTYITTSGEFGFNKGPFPCLSYKSMADLLDPKTLSWKYYVPRCSRRTAAGFSGTVRRDQESPLRTDWANVVSPETAVFDDVKLKQLPAVSWVVPCGRNSDHAAGTDNGPSWVAAVVNAIGKSPAWSTTAIIVVWDDWGGYYDHVPPAFLDNQGGLGFRVPMIVISPYSKKSVTSRTRSTNWQHFALRRGQLESRTARVNRRARDQYRRHVRFHETASRVYADTCSSSSVLPARRPTRRRIAGTRTHCRLPHAEDNHNHLTR